MYWTFRQGLFELYFQKGVIGWWPFGALHSPKGTGEATRPGCVFTDARATRASSALAEHGEWNILEHKCNNCIINMRAKKTPAKAAAIDTSSRPSRRQRKERKFQRSRLKIQHWRCLKQSRDLLSGQKVRRLTLFEKLDQSPDSTESKRLITASGQYGLTKGSYTAEYLELTPEGSDTTSDEVTPPKKLQTRFNLAIKNHAPFDFLYEKLKGNKMPVKEVMADYLSEANVEDDEKAECIDTFIGEREIPLAMRTIAGSERIIRLSRRLKKPGNRARASSWIINRKLRRNSIGGQSVRPH